MLKRTLIFVGIMILLTIGFLYADGTGSGSDSDPLAEALLDLCDGLMGLIGPLAYLLVTFAAVVYLFGQLGDAQMRAKASVWAQSAIFGAVIGWIIIQIVPHILAMLLKASGVTIECGGGFSTSGQCTDIIEREFCSSGSGSSSGP